MQCEESVGDVSECKPTRPDRPQQHVGPGCNSQWGSRMQVRVKSTRHVKSSQRTIRAPRAIEVGGRADASRRAACAAQPPPFQVRQRGGSENDKSLQSPCTGRDDRRQPLKKRSQGRGMEPRRRVGHYCHGPLGVWSRGSVGNGTSDHDRWSVAMLGFQVVVLPCTAVDTATAMATRATYISVLGCCATPVAFLGASSIYLLSLFTAYCLAARAQLRHCCRPQ